MRNSPWIILFFAALTAYTAGVELRNDMLQYVFKPLLMPLLAIHLIYQLRASADRLKKWVLLALAFSWSGDILLMLEKMDPLFFILGLSSFLLAHICYVIFFQRVRINEGIKHNLWFLLIVVGYYATLVTILSPYLGDLKWPVRIYGIVISCMFVLAIHLVFIPEKKAGKWMMLGALLFIISDSILAINKFYHPFSGAGSIIILTYAFAQLLIVLGAIKYIRTRKNK